MSALCCCWFACIAALSAYADTVLPASQLYQCMPILYCLHSSYISISQYCTACLTALPVYANTVLPALQLYQHIPIRYCLHCSSISVSQYCTVCLTALPAYTNTVLLTLQLYQRMPILYCQYCSSISIRQYCTANIAALSAYANIVLPVLQLYQCMPILYCLLRSSVSVCQYCTACLASLPAHANTCPLGISVWTPDQSKQWFKDWYLLLPSLALDSGLPVRQQYKITTSVRSHTSVHVLILSEMLPGRKTPTNQQLVHGAVGQSKELLLLVNRLARRKRELSIKVASHCEASEVGIATATHSVSVPEMWK